MPRYQLAYRKLIIPISNLGMADKNQRNRMCKRLYKYIYTSVPNSQTDSINIAAVPFAMVIQDVSERVDAPEHFKVEVLPSRIDTQLRDAHTVTLFADKGRGSFINSGILLS